MIRFIRDFWISIVAIICWIAFLGILELEVTSHNGETVWTLYSWITIYEKGKLKWLNFRKSLK